MRYLWTCLLVLGLSLVGRAADKPLVLELWPNKVPGPMAEYGEEKISGEPRRRQLTNVHRPTITVFRPDPAKANSAAVLIAPGGGYNFLAWDHEGEAVAHWLNTLGVTGIVLKYRVPIRPGQPRNDPTFAPHQDAQRALRLVRSKAKEWGLDPQQIGMLGFSAGGHLTALTATNFTKQAYQPIDEADPLSARPDFIVLIYPGGLLQQGGEQLVPGLTVSKETPPAFFVHCSDDRVSSENSVRMFLALKRAGVPTEVHIYAVGGHGFGMRPSKHPVSNWPQRCEEWLRARGNIKAETGQTP